MRKIKNVLAILLGATIMLGSSVMVGAKNDNFIFGFQYGQFCWICCNRLQ